MPQKAPAKTRNEQMTTALAGPPFLCTTNTTGRPSGYQAATVKAVAYRADTLNVCINKQFAGLFVRTIRPPDLHIPPYRCALGLTHVAGNAHNRHGVR